MTELKVEPALDQDELIKVPTGIPGFDDVAGGGLPEGRPTLVCGGPGCGKTLFGMEFLVRGPLSSENRVSSYRLRKVKRI